MNLINIIASISAFIKIRIWLKAKAIIYAKRMVRRQRKQREQDRDWFWNKVDYEYDRYKDQQAEQWCEHQTQQENYDQIRCR